MWTAYSRTLGKIVAFVIGRQSDCAYELYTKGLHIVGNIELIYTDAYSCYKQSFENKKVASKHVVAHLKSQTHLIESTNSSLRDNLARFNRMTKRYTKSLCMLANSLTLFCHYNQFSPN